ncbi:winged helix-turn-helix transcriptional regulator [Streptomyces rugosispiralis]|uniref:Helix-turn-helix transcriptional regulator n=1 Tax=Streptomyces rugosispiralis TaxID=2967341 RepID=A0ABT1VBF1_9ACTN|nr:helix-turn-helix domain-containing protein [Streptomyces rugosispiralis]MCQ8194308.1 helix-turn-helix transcriptional regulator [Streptomyces rugosispiralis]
MADAATPRRHDVFHSDCPAREILDHVASRWGALILCALGTGSHRFYELRDRVDGISEKMLSQTLRALARDGLVERTVEPATPPRVSYALTPLGVELAGRLQGLIEWITVRAQDVAAAQRGYDRAAAARSR